MNLLLQVAPLVLLAAGIVVFIRLRARDRKALAASQAKLQQILQAIESATDAIGIGDFEGNSLYHNPAHIALFGYTVEELNSVPGTGVLFADKTIAKAIIAAIFAGRSWTGETDILTKDGRRIPAAVKADVIRDASGKPVGIFGIFRDISREKKLGEEADRASKLDSLGMMAGGIAHDFNNLLTVVLGQVGLAQLEPSLPKATNECLKEIEAVSLRARDLTDRMKSFARGESPTKRLIRIDKVVREAASLAVKNSRVELDCVLAGNLPAVLADEAQLFQVVNNLCLNAVQAMPTGGDLIVSSSIVEPAAAAAETLADGRWLKISIADTGAGISPENMKRLFEPFFTTKRKGTGLGLATCFSIVAKHGGHLRVESAVGQGTTFHLILPASDLAPDESPERQPAKLVSKSA